jgi:hypothetical protein
VAVGLGAGGDKEATHQQNDAAESRHCICADVRQFRFSLSFSLSPLFHVFTKTISRLTPPCNDPLQSIQVTKDMATVLEAILSQRLKAFSNQEEINCANNNNNETQSTETSDRARQQLPEYVEEENEYVYEDDKGQRFSSILDYGDAVRSLSLTAEQSDGNGSDNLPGELERLMKALQETDREADYVTDDATTTLQFGTAKWQ